jgi:hypothetical protein
MWGIRGVGWRRGWLSGCFGGFWVGREVALGALDALDEEVGAAEVHAVAGEAGGDFAEGLLDGGSIVEMGQVVGRVFDDGGDGVAAMVEADELVVHGGGSAAVAVVFVAVSALVRFGGFAGEVGVAVGHDNFPLYIQVID